MTGTAHDATDRLQKWLLGVMGGLVLLLMSLGVPAFFHIMREVGDLKTSVTNRLSVLETKMTLMLNREKRIEAVEEWQRNWPQTGQLKEDVEQNSRLGVLEHQLDDIQTALKDIRVRRESGG